MRKIFIGYNNAANAITLAGILLAITGCFLSFYGNIRAAIIFLIIAGICDLFDGAVARKLKRTEDEKLFGIQLDSLADIICFGIVPVIISMNSGADKWYAMLFYAVYICSAVIRLAYFNSVTAQNGDNRYYQGVPVTYIALIMPMVFLFGCNAANVTMFAVMSVLYIANIKIPKPKGIWYILFPLLAIGLIAAWGLYDL